MANTNRTTKGLISLLERHGIKPTFDSKKDIQLAREFMPAPYKGNNKNDNKNK